MKDSKRCTLKNVEFANNTQSDIAILEGAEDLVIDGCYHTDGLLHINLEPNVDTPLMRGIKLQNMRINKLSLLCNALNNARDHVVLVENCLIESMHYDGLGSEFINSRVNNFINIPDNLDRTYGAYLKGLCVSQTELILDPAFSNVSSPGGSSFWELEFSTTPAVNRYNRDSEDLFVIGNASVPQATIIRSGSIPVTDGVAYAITICREIKTFAARPDTVYVNFYNSGGSVIGPSQKLARAYSPGEDIYTAILVAPAGAVTAKLFVSNSDSSTAQVIAYRFASFRELAGEGVGIDIASIFYNSDLRRIKIPTTKAGFDSLQYNWCPLPAGSIVEFAYAPGAVRLAQVTAKASDNQGRFGTLQVIANYP